MIFIKKFQILEEKVSFCFITLNFVMLLLLHKTFKGSRNIQGFVLIRAALFKLKMFSAVKFWLFLV